VTSTVWNAVETWVLDLALEWEVLLDLPSITVEHVFVPTTRDDDADTAADTDPKWQYRQATIRWYLPVCASMGREALEAVLVHEYAHVLMGAINDRLKPGSDEHAEYATENVARALLALRYTDRGSDASEP